jgi:hypothetical protein
VGSDEPITKRYPYQPPTGQKCRVFVSHAGEQKKLLVDIISETLQRDHPALRGQVFVDERSLRGGDDAMREMYESLRDACVGEEISSPAVACVVFFL